LPHQVRSLGHYEIVAIAQRFSQRVDGGIGRLLAERVQGGELVFEFALAGHEEEFNSVSAVSVGAVSYLGSRSINNGRRRGQRILQHLN
jgi:hypothetical protein